MKICQCKYLNKKREGKGQMRMGSKCRSLQTYTSLAAFFQWYYGVKTSSMKWWSKLL